MATRKGEIISSHPAVKLKATNDDFQSGCCPGQFSPCYWWSSCCSWYLHLLERFFGWLGERIAKHPLVTISVCLAFVSICSVGFVWFQPENRTEELFIPQSSQAIDDLNTAEKYFRIKYREEIILLVASLDHPNVLDPECLRQAFKAYHAVIGLESYTDYCVTLSGDKAKSVEDCMMINPLEFLQYNESNLNNKTLEQVQLEVNRAYSSPTSLMRNGRPFPFNFDRMFGSATQQNGSIIDAKVLQMVYLIRDPDDDNTNEKVLKWEKMFIDKVSALVDTLPCFEVHYSSGRSLDDAIAESSGSDITLVSITFTLMISFACFMLGKFLNPLTGHSLLANAGVFAVALGILAGFGLAMWCRVPFVSLVGVLPFLVLGIGIDDMFILVDELDRQPRDMSKTDVIKAVMARSGATVTMTTVTDLVAFAVSTSTSFPAIRYFCIYAALTVTLSFLMIVTYFVAIMFYDVKRIRAGRRDFLPFCRAPPPKEGAPAWDEPLPQTSNRVMRAWGKFLTYPVTKAVVLTLSLALLGAGIFGVTRVDEAFDRNVLAKDDSYLKQFLSAEEKHFEVTIPVSIIETGDIEYGEESTQKELGKLSNIVVNNEYYTNESLSWMDSFVEFTKARNTSINGSAFLPQLKEFLSVPNNSYFAQDLKFSKDGKKLEASRIFGFMRSSVSSTFQKNAMLTLRRDIAEKSKLNAFPISRLFIFFEQYAITTRETTRNLIIAAVAVLVITSPFLVDCTVTVLVVFNFVALICELFGLMVIWNVSLNAVSMINLVMAIGFAVDYSAHIAHAYVTSNKATANERVVDALTTLGASVFMGGFSTFLGMIVLGFAASEIFRIFFRMFLGIVVLGLLHGLCILPVHLSLLCCRSAVVRPHSGRVSVEKKSNREQEDGRSEDFRLASPGSEKLASPGVCKPSFESFEPKEETLSFDCGKASQKEVGTAETINCEVRTVTEIGLENKGMENDEEEIGVTSTAENAKHQNTFEEPDFSKESVKNNEESACLQENSTNEEEDVIPVTSTESEESSKPSHDDPTKEMSVTSTAEHAKHQNNFEEPGFTKESVKNNEESARLQENSTNKEEDVIPVTSTESEDSTKPSYDEGTEESLDVNPAQEGTTINMNEEQDSAHKSAEEDLPVSTQISPSDLIITKL